MSGYHGDNPHHSDSSPPVHMSKGCLHQHRFYCIHYKTHYNSNILFLRGHCMQFSANIFTLVHFRFIFITVGHGHQLEHSEAGPHARRGVHLHHWSQS